MRTGFRGTDDPSRGTPNRSRHALTTLLAASLLLSPADATAQQDQHPASQIQNPSEFHGYELGTRYTITSALYDYYKYLGDRSSRIDYSSYGKSIQGRELPMLVVSSEKNLARKQQIKQNLRELTERSQPLPEDRLQELVSQTPAIVWLFIVDTDEEAGVEVLQEVAYNLATSDSDRARMVRDSLVVVLTPLTNPDSHTRYVTWHKLYNVDGASTDPNAIENDAHWGMNTDGNAWGVDVNRDFGWFVTPEMRALAREATEWTPQIWLDIHSGPDVIFIPPFPRPFHPLWPDAAVDWWQRLGNRAGKHFGERQWTFNSRQDYEGVTSVGFGLSWGMLGPAVSGMLYESFGGRPEKTLAFRRDDGTIATMREAMDYHALGIWSLLEVSAENRTQLLRDAHETVQQAVDTARAHDVKGVVLPTDEDQVDPRKLDRLIQRLTLQGVEVRRATEPFSVRSRSYRNPSTSPESRRFPAGTYYVSFIQPDARLARTLLDPTIDYSNPLVDVPYDRRMPYYDVTWSSLPLLFGVPAFTANEVLQTASETVEDGPAQTSEVDALARDEPPYAYLLPAGRETSYRAAIQMMEEGYRFRVATGSFRIGETTYGKGTFAALAERNPEDLGRRLKAMANEQGAHVIEVASPFTRAGTTFGSETRMEAIEPPLVAIVSDWPVRQDHIYGGIRSVLEGDFDFTFTPVMLETVNSADLTKYSAVVLPHAGMSIRGGPGFGEGYQGKLDMENLRRYVERGGTLVAVKGAGAEVAQDSILGQGINFQGWSGTMNGAALRAVWRQGVEQTEEPVAWERGLEVVGSPILAPGVLGSDFAAPGAYPVLFGITEGSNAKVMARYGDEPASLVLDGFAPPEARSEVAGRPFVVVQPVGEGRVVYFADDPTFRGHWYGLNTMFMNTLLFGSLL